MKTYKEIIQEISLAKTYDDIMKIKFSHLDWDAYDCIQYLHDWMRKKNMNQGNNYWGKNIILKSNNLKYAHYIPTIHRQGTALI